jgi:prevent-host-death family protein
MITRKVKTVGAYEAKTRLSALLKEVAGGKEIIITRRDRPVAKLVPIAPAQPVWPDEELFARMKAFRESHTLPKGETIRDLIDAGRRS